MANENVAANSAVGKKRIAVLDIETVSLDPNNKKGALSATTGRIVCIGLAFDDGTRFVPTVICESDERRMLERFWQALRPDDLIVGHNVLSFDLMFIRQRCWILGVEPRFSVNLKKYYTEQVVDLMELWTNWSSRFTGAGLDDIACALGVGQKTASGEDVQKWFAAGDYKSIVSYNVEDLRLEYRVFCRMHYRAPLGEGAQAEARPVTAPAYVPPAPAAAPKPTTTVLPFQLPTHEPAPAPYRYVSDGRGGMRQLEPESRTIGFHTPAPQVAPSTPATPGPSVPHASAPRRRSRASRVMYVEQNGQFVLTGKTFEVKEGLKALGAHVVKGADDKVIGWSIATDKFDALAGLCARNGLALVEAQAAA